MYWYYRRTIASAPPRAGKRGQLAPGRPRRGGTPARGGGRGPQPRTVRRKPRREKAKGTTQPGPRGGGPAGRQNNHQTRTGGAGPARTTARQARRKGALGGPRRRQGTREAGGARRAPRRRRPARAAAAGGPARIPKEAPRAEPGGPSTGQADAGAGPAEGTAKAGPRRPPTRPHARQANENHRKNGAKATFFNLATVSDKFCIEILILYLKSGQIFAIIFL